MNKILVKWLQENAGVEGRVFPLVLPAKTQRPAVTYQRVSGGLELGLNYADSDTDSRVQIDVYATSYAVAQQIKNKISLGLNGFQQGNIYQISIDNIRDEYEEDEKLFREIIDLKVITQEG